MKLLCEIHKTTLLQIDISGKLVCDKCVDEIKEDEKNIKQKLDKLKTNS